LSEGWRAFEAFKVPKSKDFMAEGGREERSKLFGKDNTAVQKEHTKKSKRIDAASTENPEVGTKGGVAFYVVLGISQKSTRELHGRSKTTYQIVLEGRGEEMNRVTLVLQNLKIREATWYKTSIS